MTDDPLKGIRTSIYVGDLDDHLETLINAIQDRLKEVAKLKWTQMPPGSLVRFNDLARPKYLVGVPATVTERKDKRVVVILGQDVGRFKKGTPIRSYTNTLDLVSGPTND